MSAEENLLALLGEGTFKRWFKNAVFTSEGITVDSHFKADWIGKHFDAELFRAFGFAPKIAVEKNTRQVALVHEKESAPPLPFPVERATKPKTGFAAREMILLNLPHSDPKAPVWRRKNGKLSLIVQGGYRENQTTGELDYMGIPYGATARLLLFYLMSEATLTKSPRIFLGNSFNAFLETIGASKTGGKKSGATAVIRQLERLLTASFSVQCSIDHKETRLFAGENARFVKKFELWFSKKEAEQAAFWESYIDLSPELFESLKQAAVPLNWDILVKLRKSPLALDLYAWLTYEAARAQQTGKGRFVPWAALKDQMGAEYERLNNFVAAAKRELAKIKKLYTGLSLGKRHGGLEIMADSLPSVERPALPSKE